MRWLMDLSGLNNLMVKIPYRMSGLKEIRQTPLRSWATTWDYRKFYWLFRLAPEEAAHQRFANADLTKVLEMPVAAMGARQSALRTCPCPVVLMKKIKGHGGNGGVYVDEGDQWHRFWQMAYALHLVVSIASHLLGLAWSWEKDSHLPSTLMPHIGWGAFLDWGQLWLPLVRSREIRDAVKTMLLHTRLAKRMKVRQKASLVGKVVAAGPAAPEWLLMITPFKINLRDDLRASKQSYDALVTMPLRLAQQLEAMLAVPDSNLWDWMRDGVTVALGSADASEFRWAGGG